MLKNDYLDRMRPYQNDFSDSLNSVFVGRFAYPNIFGTSQTRKRLADIMVKNI
jgi:hypothetical protein